MFRKVNSRGLVVSAPSILPSTFILVACGRKIIARPELSPKGDYRNTCETSSLSVTKKLRSVSNSGTKLGMLPCVMVARD